MIRDAGLEDVPAIVSLAVKMHAESNYASIPVYAPHVARFVIWLLKQPGGKVLISIGDREINGFMFGFASPAWFGNGIDETAQDSGLYVEPHARHTGVGPALVSAFKDWCLARPHVKQIRTGTTAGQASKGAGVIYERAGFQCTGSTYLFDVAASRTDALSHIAVMGAQHHEFS